MLQRAEAQQPDHMHDSLAASGLPQQGSIFPSKLVALDPWCAAFGSCKGQTFQLLRCAERP